MKINLTSFPESSAQVGRSVADHSQWVQSLGVRGECRGLPVRATQQRPRVLGTPAPVLRQAELVAGPDLAKGYRERSDRLQGNGAVRGGHQDLPPRERGELSHGRGRRQHFGLPGPTDCECVLTLKTGDLKPNLNVVQQGILLATVHHKNTLTKLVNEKESLHLVELPGWAGLGGVRYVPPSLVHLTTDQAKEELNRLNTLLVKTLRSTDSAFSLGEEDDALACVRFGMVTEDTGESASTRPEFLNLTYKSLQT